MSKPRRKTRPLTDTQRLDRLAEIVEGIQFSEGENNSAYFDIGSQDLREAIDELLEQEDHA